MSTGRRWLRRLRHAALVVVGSLVVSMPLGPWLIREQPLDSPEAILVLGSHEYERLPEAALHARRWPDAVVLLTQPLMVTPYNCQDCANRARTLGEAGVSAGRVRVLEPPVQNTFDELQAAAAWLRTTGHRRLLVVTSPYHTRRVTGLTAQLLPGTTVGVAACAVPDGLATPWWSRRYDRRYVLYEMAAMVDNSWRRGISPRRWLVR